MITRYSKVPTSHKFLRIAILQVHRNRCFYTGRTIDIADFHIDHILPKTKGGKDCIDNYVPTCSDINHKKSGRHYPDLYEVAMLANSKYFVQQVVDLYNDLQFGQEATEGYAEINKYMKDNNIANISGFRQLCRYRLQYLRITKPGQTKARLYYNIKELDGITKYRYPLG